MRRENLPAPNVLPLPNNVCLLIRSQAYLYLGRTPLGIRYNQGREYLHWLDNLMYNSLLCATLGIYVGLQPSWEVRG